MKKILLITIALIGIITTYIACRKTEVITTSTSIEDKFFKNHPTNNAKINAVLDYVKRKNDVTHFVDKTVERIGYPFWDKALIVNTTNKIQRSSSDMSETFYIPFSLENDNSTKAILAVKVTGNDTTHTFIGNWQYRNYTSTTDTTKKADKVALLFMQFDKSIFLHKKFLLKDTALFNDHSRPIYDTTRRTLIINTITNTTGKTNVLSTLTICFDMVYCGSVAWCEAKKGKGGCDALDPCPYGICYPTIKCDFIDIDSGPTDDGGSGGGGSGSSGEGGSDDWTPPPPCNGLTGGKTSLTDNPPCEPGWEPVEEEEDLTVLPTWIVDSVTTRCFQKALTAVSGGSRSTLFKEIYNVFDTSLKLDLIIVERDSLPGDVANESTVSNSASPNAYISEIQLNRKILKKCSQEYISYVFIHEMVHAAMDVKLIVWDSTKSEHEEMMGKYLDKIAASLMLAYPNLSKLNAYSICYWSFNNAIDGTIPSFVFMSVLTREIKKNLQMPSLTTQELIDNGEKYSYLGTGGTRLNCN